MKGVTLKQHVFEFFSLKLNFIEKSIINFDIGLKYNYLRNLINSEKDRLFFTRGLVLFAYA